MSEAYVEPAPRLVGSGKTAAWIKALVLFHLFCIVVWTLPSRPELLKPEARPVGTDLLLAQNAREMKPKDWVRAYLFGSGVWQYWDMFAPNPANTDIYGDALVQFKSGRTLVYEYPRMYTLPIPGKFPQERYRKFYERISSEDTPFLWAPFAQRVADNVYTDPKDPPLVVTLRKYTRALPKPGEKPIRDYTRTDFFRYAVDQKRLPSR